MILAAAASVIAFNIAAGPLVDRMPDFAMQSGVQVLYKFDAGMMLNDTSELHGEMTAREALARLLGTTNVTVEWVKPDVVALNAPRWPYVDERGRPYACVPTAWVAGIIFTRLGQLLWRMHEFESELYCTPAGAT